MDSLPHPPAILPPISTLPTLPDSELFTILDTLFEPSHYLHAMALPTLHSKKYDSYPDMIDTIGSHLSAIATGVRGADVASSSGSATEQREAANSQARETLHAILGSHPRLGEKKVESAMSRLEQAQLRGPDAGSAASGAGTGISSLGKRKASEMSEADQLAQLNMEYEEKYPGLRYVVFVNGRGRDVIMEDMKNRIARNDIALEEEEAISAMCEIAKNRAETIQKAAELQQRVMGMMSEA